MGKLIVIEGTDCSGKETQTNKLVEKLEVDGLKVARESFPMYETPTGKIIGACLLGKPQMCDELLKSNHGFFPEGGGNVDPVAASLLYVADRRYNLPIINDMLENNDVVILDRYVVSNMAHRGGMIKGYSNRIKMYKKLDELEYNFAELPRPDKTIILYMPYEYACALKKNRTEAPDEAEQNEEYLKNGEAAYLDLARIYNYDIIDCVDSGRIKSIDDISNEVYNNVKEYLNSNKKTK